MAWERSFEKRILKVRDKELKYQKLNYTIEVLQIQLSPINLSDEAFGNRLSGILSGWYSSNHIDSEYSKLSLKEWFTHFGNTRIILALCGCEGAATDPFDSLYIDT